MLKILIVDDEHDIEIIFNHSFKNELNSGELKFSYAFFAEEAIQFMKTLDPFDIVLVLSDINMPGMNGLDLLKYSKQNFPDLKVIMISAYGDNNNGARATAHGADDFVTKPINFQLLKEKIKSLKI